MFDKGCDSMKRFGKSNEFILIVISLVLFLCFGLVNSTIFTIANLFAVVRAGIINFIFALSVLLIMISGGIDMSFMAIGSLSMYVVIKNIHDHRLNLPVAAALVLIILTGVLLGLINAVLVDRLKLNPFVVTLGTQSLYKGFLLTFVGTAFIVDLPDSLMKMSQTNLFSVVDRYGRTSALNVSALVVIVLYIGVYLFLKYTMLGKSIYAMGGDNEAAIRVGLNLLKLRCIVFGLAGAIAAIGGITETVLTRTANPSALIGNELNVIAGVVLGGGNAQKGKGTVFGTFLGVLLLTFVNNSLTALRIPSYWQAAVSGLIIIIGTVGQSYRSNTLKIAKS